MKKGFFSPLGMVVLDQVSRHPIRVLGPHFNIHLRSTKQQAKVSTLSTGCAKANSHPRIDREKNDQINSETTSIYKKNTNQEHALQRADVQYQLQTGRSRRGWCRKKCTYNPIHQRKSLLSPVQIENSGIGQIAPKDLCTTCVVYCHISKMTNSEKKKRLG